MLLVPTEITSSSEYNSENEASTSSSSLPLYIITFYPTTNIIITITCQFTTILKYKLIQLNKLGVAGLLATRANSSFTDANCSSGTRRSSRIVVLQLNTGSNIEVAKPQIFDETTENTSGFITVCKLFIRIKIRNNSIEKQIQ